VKQLIVAAIVLILLLLMSAGGYVWKRPMEVFNRLNRRALAKAGFTKTHVSSPIGEQTVWTNGSGPVLVFLHGLGDNAGSWSKVAPQFTGQYRVVIPDLAGHAESEPKDGPLSLEKVLTATEAVIEAESGGKPVTIVGNSLGAWLGLLYAQHHPDRVSRVVLVNGGPLRGNRPDLTLMPKNRAEASKLFDSLLDPGSPRVPGFVLDDIVRISQTGVISRMAQAADSANQFVMEDRLNEITVPVDLVWGESDHMLPLEYAHRMESGIPAVRLTTVPRCGHVPQQECPVTFAATLKKVLSEAPPTTKLPAASGEAAVAQ
jgi:pimeloyl-ACP methyl ester carboxylesterase